ncbi:MAG: PH domain-containing protein [Bacteroidota bacterium]
MKYTSSLDKLARGLTIGITTLFLAIIAGQFFVFKQSDAVVTVSVTVGLVLGYLVVFVFRPVNYYVLNDKVIIHRPIKDVIIDKKNISTIELLDRKRLRGAIHLFGVGGLFGYFGIFGNASVGRMTWYATRLDRAVLITTITKQKIVLTPDEPVAFMIAVKTSNGNDVGKRKK